MRIRHVVNASAVLLFSFACSVPSLTQQQTQPVVVMVPDGTAVRLSLEEQLSSATSQAGDQIRLRVAEDVRVGMVLVVPSGSPAIGHIVTDEKKKTLGRGGKIDLTVDYVKPNNLGQMRVRATAKRAGKDSTGKVITLTVLITPLFLIMHGHDVIIPKDTTFTAYVDGEQDVTVMPYPVYPNSGVTAVSAVSSGHAAPQAFVESAPATPSAPEPLATVKLKSNPDGAEISVDGDFVGNAPSVLKLEPGHHKILVTQSGFQSWERTVTLGAGAEISVEANLEKVQDK